MARSSTLRNSSEKRKSHSQRWGPQRRPWRSKRRVSQRSECGHNCRVFSSSSSSLLVLAPRLTVILGASHARLPHAARAVSPAARLGSGVVAPHRTASWHSALWCTQQHSHPHTRGSKKALECNLNRSKKRRLKNYPRVGD